MGIVYSALDPVVKREVALKMIRDGQDRGVLELFKRECAVLASMSHPNIVEIFDIGETEEAGATRPYFVMPLLRGATLQELIKTSSARLTVERSLQIVAQVCRGLQAAHDQGLIHRDLKPSNLFVLSDDSVKIIDFGMAHLINTRSATGLKGTLPYMAPEQIQRKKPTPLGDQFSLGVICYEMLARRHPFRASGFDDLGQAILSYTPPPVSDFNPLVSSSISQVVHKALAKEPFHRFSNVREFSDCLQRAFRGETIELFDSARITARLGRARKAFEAGDLDDAAEIVKELESEMWLVPEIRELGEQIEQMARARVIKQSLDTAHRRFEEGEFVRALQKVQEVRDLDPGNTDAFRLIGEIESKRSGTQIEEWLRLANQHLENHAYPNAREALEKVLDLRPKEVRAETLLMEVERREQEHIRLRHEKQEAYKSALEAYRRGDLNSALHKLERVLDLDRRAPDSNIRGKGAEYQRMYEEVRSRRDLFASKEAEARRYVTEGNLAAAAALCEEVLLVLPNNVVFLFLRDDIEQTQRLEMSAYIARIEREVAAEADLNRKVSILEEATQRCPSEPRFEYSLSQARSRRDLVESIVKRARDAEELRQFSDAHGHWETLRSIYPQYPGLDIEIDRLRKRREQQVRVDAKARWVRQIDQALGVNDHQKAASLVIDALIEFPADPELSALRKQAEQVELSALDAEIKAARGTELHARGEIDEGLALLRQASQVDSRNPTIRNGLIDALLNTASRIVDSDWRAAEPLIHEALDLDPNNPLAKSLKTVVQDKREGEEVSVTLSNARQLQASGRIKNAIAELDKIRYVYPRETRLIELRALLLANLPAQDRNELRARDLDELNRLAQESKETRDLHALESIFQKSSAFSKYGSDDEFRGPLSAIEERVRKERAGAQSLANAPTVVSDGTVEEQSFVHLGWQPVAGQPPPKKPTISFPQLKPRIVWVGVIFLLVALVLAAVLRSPGPIGGTLKKHVASNLVTVSVSNAQNGQYKILDSAGADVTIKALRGLSAGRYTLVALRPGSMNTGTPFTINPSEETSKKLAIAWQPLVARLHLKLKSASGVVKVDGKTQMFEGSSGIDVPWPNGRHSVSWQSSEKDSVKVEVEVNDTAINVAGSPEVRGAVFGLVAVINNTEVGYQAINIPGGITKIVDGQTEPLRSLSGGFPAQGARLVGFTMKHGGYPLGDVAVPPNGERIVYVFLAPDTSVSTSKRVQSRPPPISEPPPQPVVTPPAGSTEEERKAKKDHDDEIKRKLEQYKSRTKGATEK